MGKEEVAFQISERKVNDNERGKVEENLYTDGKMTYESKESCLSDLN